MKVLSLARIFLRSSSKLACKEKKKKKTFHSFEKEKNKTLQDNGIHHYSIKPLKGLFLLQGSLYHTRHLSCFLVV